jgi:DMSO/TMAO reductase YedYZ molybdopterin-dependent catalytic subunit/nitrite reductase/ring-hydroxylating ferredoxin subunit
MLPSFGGAIHFTVFFRVTVRVKLSNRGYSESAERVPPGWRVVNSDRRPINNSIPPDFKMEEWRLKIYGEVENPREYTYEEFQNLPHVAKILDHHCVDGWSYLGQKWSGVDISVIKERSHVRNSARYLIVESIKGASQRFPIDQDLLLADGQDDAPLSMASGYPLRLVAPGEFGFKSRKWVGSIKFCAEVEMDKLDKAFEKIGVYELYSSKVGPFNPWTVDSKDRKKFLRAVFAFDTDSTRLDKKKYYQKQCANDTVALGVDSAKICTQEDLEQSNVGIKTVVNGNEIFLVQNRDGEIYAIEPICTHMGTDISRGKFNCDAGTLKCPLHGAVFDVRTGNCLSGSMGCDGDTFPDARVYKIKVKEGAVFVERNQPWGSLW